LSQPPAEQPPYGPTNLPKRAWWAALKRTVRQFVRDNMVDRAAGLTYYGILSIFPGIVVLTAMVGLIGASATEPLIENIQKMAPGQAREVLVNVIRELERSSGIAGPLAVLGILVALWAASAYIGAFMRAANVIYKIEEGRPVWKTVPLRVALTIAMIVMLAVAAIGVVVTGTIAERVGRFIGIGSTGVLIWDVAKWPVLAVLVSLAFALLYWAAPNVRQLGFRWMTPGSMLAVALWVVVSAGFAVYVANFSSYNKVYGSLAGAVVFLIWLWLSNLAMLLGAGLDAELARAQRIEEGHPETKEPFLPARDTQAMPVDGIVDRS
jgi:membrane protein